MNTENLKTLAAKLRTPEAAAHFDYADWFYSEDESGTIGERIKDCGTVACIAGWAAVIAAPETPAADPQIWDIAREWLGLDRLLADRLFVSTQVSNLRPEQAAQVVDHLIETGEVNWSVVR